MEKLYRAEIIAGKLVVKECKVIKVGRQIATIIDGDFEIYIEKKEIDTPFGEYATNKVHAKDQFIMKNYQDLIDARKEVARLERIMSIIEE